MDISKFELIIFDIDGTLVKPWTESLLPNVRETIDGLSPDMRVAFATNQGGPALRKWMEVEGWGNPEEYPYFPAVRERLLNIRAALFGPESRWPIMVSTAYQTQGGKWAPVWDERDTITRNEKVNLHSIQNRYWRKPNPGMLHNLVFRFGLPPAKILFVGDSDDDQVAAAAAFMTFAPAREFFGWDDEAG